MSNPRRVQALYLRIGVSALSFIKRPTGYFAAWDQTNPGGIGNAGARYMGPAIGTAQRTIAAPWAAVPNDGQPYRLGFAQFLSDPFVRQSVAAGNWTLGFAQLTTNAGATIDWNGNAALYVVDGRSGTRRATVFNLRAVGNVHTNNDERTAYEFGLIPGQAFELFTGDYLCLEVGVAIRNTGGAAAVPLTSIFADGTTEIIGDADVTASAKAALFSPVYFTTALPEPGEPPAPSVTSAEARQLMRGALPPNTFHDFDDSTSPDYELLAWMAEVFKRLGYDLLDIMERELDVRTAVLKLREMRATWGVTQDPPRIQEQRALIQARMREYGAPASLFGAAAAIGVVLGYDDPSALEIMEISAAQLQAALRYNYPASMGGPVPEAAAFDATNLILRTPFLYDGGAVWDAGSKLFLRFDAVCGKQVHARLVGPDGTTVDWSPLTHWHEVNEHVLYGKGHARKAVHGNWTLFVRRTPGSPAVSLLGDLGPIGPGSALYVAGAPAAYVGPEVDPPLGPPQPRSVPNVVRRAGLGRHKFWWGVFADPALLSVKTAADFGAARAALGRIRHGYQAADLILSKAPIPTDPGDPLTAGSQALPDGCVPS